MAIPLPNSTILPLHGRCSNPALLLSLFTPSAQPQPQPQPQGRQQILRLRKRPPILPTAIADSKTDGGSLSSMINNLETEQETNNAPRPPTKRLADSWREIQGQDDWAGLLDPIDPLLRSELILYGEMAQACYDAFDYDPYSKYCGSCKYNRRMFFESLGMAHSGYEVTRYLYATSNLPNIFRKSLMPTTWSRSANWMGYVAVSGDEATARLGRRDIAIAWRGTVTKMEWVADMMDFLWPISSEGIPCPDPTVKVESGFVNLYTDKEEHCRFCKYSAREQILTEVKRLMQRYSDEEVSITITGHSLGSALAILSAYDMVETGLNVGNDGRVVPVCVFSFSGPRVGNVRFKERLEGLGAKVLRVVNVHDSVPKMPGLFINERVPEPIRRLAEWFPWSYSHVGVELALDHTHSPFLKQTNDLSYHGRGQRFVLASGRDPALVNKAADFLKDHLLVPPNWRQDENKGMIMGTEGRWMRPDRTHIDDHDHDSDHDYSNSIRNLLRHMGLGSE
ncbi:Phospholipase A1-Igamma1, chloroplastic [Asimina triloba]